MERMSAPVCFLGAKMISFRMSLRQLCEFLKIMRRSKDVARPDMITS